MATSSSIYQGLLSNQLTSLNLYEGGPIESLNLLTLILQKGNTSLRNLSISKLNIEESELVKFIEALKNNHSLESLEIRHMPVTEPALIALSKVLKTNKTLRQLLIRNAGLTDDSMEILKPGLEQNTSLIGGLCV